MHNGPQMILSKSLEEFSGHHYRQNVLCIVIRTMPEYALGWVPGSGICLYREIL